MTNRIEWEAPEDPFDWSVRPRHGMIQLPFYCGEIVGMSSLDGDHMLVDCKHAVVVLDLRPTPPTYVIRMLTA